MNERSVESRRMYFGYTPSPEFICNFVDKMTTPNDVIVVAENEQLEIVGTVHIASMGDDKVELGVMVHEDYRQKGISSKMMSFAMLWCKNRGLHQVYMHCLAYNAPIIHLVQKFGLEVRKEGTEADSYITLPRTTPMDQIEETITRNMSTYYRNKNQVINTFNTFTKLLVPSLP